MAIWRTAATGTVYDDPCTACHTRRWPDRATQQSPLGNCDGVEGLDAPEAQFLAAMQNAQPYRVDGTTLELRDDTGALQVVFGAATG